MAIFSRLARVSSVFPLSARAFSTRVHVHGATGRLGRAISELPDTEALVHRSSDPIVPHNIDVVVDTSLPVGLVSLIKRLLAGRDQAGKGTPLPILVVGATGELPVADINKYAAEAPVYLCPNFASGIRLLMPTLKAFGEDPSFTAAVTEIHHTQKIDTPSGTAKSMAAVLQSSQVSSIRAADVRGTHRVDIIGHLESVEITHIAHDRKVFASGAVELAKELAEQRKSGSLDNGVHDPYLLLNTPATKPPTPTAESQETPKIFATPANLSPVQQEPTARTQKIQKLRLFTAIKTPYLPNGSIDLVAYDEHVEHQLANGVEGLVIGGTTGEGHLFSWTEHIMLIAHTKNKFGDRCFVVGNTGSNCTSEAYSNSAHGFSVGMDAALLINPYYGKTNAEGIKRHILAGMDLGPAMIYNVPGRTGQDIEPGMMRELATHPNFCGVKECMGPQRIKQYVDAGMKVWSGNDDDMHYCRHVIGSQGTVSVTSNVIPGIFRKLLFQSRNDALNDSLKPLYSWLFKEPNPIGVNTMLIQLGMAQPVFRLPYVPLDKSMREEGVRIIKDLGVDNFPGAGTPKVLEDSDFIIKSDY